MRADSRRKGQANRLVVASAEWLSAVPPWLLDEVRDERWIVLLRSLHSELLPHEKVGDAEALLYLITLSKRAPFTSGHVKIFAHLAAEVLSRRNPGMPALDLRQRQLAALERAELERLKAEIYEQRGDIELPFQVPRVRRSEAERAG